jgi:ERO1-like protein beta
MKTAAQVFYLAVFALLGNSHAVDSKSASKSQTPGPDVCAVRFFSCTLSGIHL